MAMVIPPDIFDRMTPEDAERSMRLIEYINRPEPEPVTFADLKIRTKDKRLIPFVPNEVQTRYLDILTEEYGPTCGFDWRKGVYTLRGIREDVLKARQQGMSTLWLALYFIDTINNPLTESHVYAHDGETTEKLFRVVHRFYDNLPAEKKRPRKFSNRREIVFADTESGIFVGMVGGSALGRGGTVNNAHLSERAWNTNYAELEVGLLQAIPEGGNVTRETTANGFNEYEEERQRGHRGESRFKPRFFGWNLHSEYRVQSTGEVVAETGELHRRFQATDEELRLAGSYDLSVEQLLWRREKMKDLKEKFPQEYPLTEREAFLSSGNPVFNRDTLERWETRLEGIAPIPSPDFRLDGHRHRHWDRLRDVHSQGKLTVWEEPSERVHVLVTADPASGLQREKTELDMCSASAWVFSDFRPLEQVAHLWGRWEPDEFAWIIAELAAWYSCVGDVTQITATVCPLRLTYGESVWSTLVNYVHVPQNRGNGWGGLYYHDPQEINMKADAQSPEQRTPGYPEGGGGKGFMIGSLQTCVREDSIIVNSRQTVSELFRYVHLAGGGMGAETGHDDCVSDAACAAAIRRLRGKYAVLRRNYERDDDGGEGYQGWGNARRRERE